MGERLLGLENEQTGSAHAMEILPGSRWRQHPLWRPSIVWRKPSGAQP